MIVSKFTERESSRMSEDLNASMPGQHSHCIRCRQVNCSQFVDNVTACVMATCELCGWRCHECKLQEHALTCPEERVSCVNKEYGCPHILKRSKMASHLQVCPASVVCCVEEWSRWPMYAPDKGVRMPLPHTKSYFDCGQLDVGLAMRDQRMLIDSLRAPRKLRRTLRNSLTQKYPAAPFSHRSSSFESDLTTSEDTSHTLSDDETDAPWDLAKTHPGLRESIRSRLFRVTKETTDSLAAALEMTSNVLASGSSETQSGEVNESGDGSTPSHMSEHNKSSLDAAEGHSGQTKSSSERSHQSSQKDEHQKKSGVIDGGDSVSVEHTKSFGTGSSSGDPSNSSSNLANTEDRQDRKSQSVDRSIRSSVSSDRCSDGSTRSRSTFRDMGGTQLHKLLGYQPEDAEAGSEILLHKLLGVNINIECINKYMVKPASMYTFICAQNFRRDQYRWHFKNVHQEIHQGFSGWLEQRCPLAYLGCNFSFARMEPANPNTTLYFSWLQESFGLRSNAQPLRVPCSSEYASASNPESASNSLTASQHSTETGQGFKSESQSTSRYMQRQRNVPFHDSDSKSRNFFGRGDSEGPSISNLANIDKDFDMTHSNSSTVAKADDKLVNDFNEVVTLDNQNSAHRTILYDEAGDKASEIQDSRRSPSQSQEREIGKGSKFCVSVQPMIYTALNWDSKVLFQYDVEEENDEDHCGPQGGYQTLTDLPFEVIRQIAKHLDSFSLCNVALTCRLLRDVCCSLLDHYGIVLLNWQKQKSGANGEVSWKVINKRWLFSTSFEPIRSWKFTDNHPTIGDHLKVCPFNKDIVRHTQPTRLMFTCPDSQHFTDHGLQK